MAGILHFPLACFVGLATGGAEVTMTGYVRQPTVLVACADGVTYANPISLQWQNATRGWGNLDTVQLWDASAGGSLLGAVPATAVVPINQYDIARIPASGLAVTYDKANRPYGTGSFGTYGYGTLRVFNGAIFVPLPYGSGLYGSGVYGGYLVGARLERAFDQQHVCAPGTWTPGPFALAA